MMQAGKMCFPVRMNLSENVAAWMGGANGAQGATVSNSISGHLHSGLSSSTEIGSPKRQNCLKA